MKNNEKIDYGLSLNHNLGEKVMFTFERNKEGYPVKYINK